MHAGIHNFELHAFRAAFQMVPNNFVFVFLNGNLPFQSSSSY